MKKIFYSLLFLLTLVGCSQQEGLVPDRSGEAIVLNGNIGGLTAETRAPIDPTHAGVLDVAFARIDQTGASTWGAWNGATTLQAKRAGTEGTAAITFNEGSEQYYTTGLTNNGIKYIGWYPNNAVSAGKVNFTIDGKTDVMWTSAVQGSATDKFSNANKVFAFNHQLVRMEVSIWGDTPSPDLWGTVNQIRILNTPVSATMTLADTPTLSWGATGAVFLKNSNDTDFKGASHVILNNGYSRNAGYVLLAPADSYTFEVTTAKGGTRKVTVEKQFLASNKYRVIFRFDSTGITSSATIGTWGDGGGASSGGFPNNE